MPFLDADSTSPAGFLPQIDKPVEAPKPTWTELWDAANQDNTAVSIANAAGRAFDRSQTADVPGYDPFSDIQGYEGHASSFVDANSPAEVDLVKKQIDRENKARETIGLGGASGVAVALASGLLDPVNLLPGGIAFDAVRGASKAGKVAKAVGETAAAGLVATSAAEGILQSTQETRTAKESAINVAAGTLLSGVMGGALGLVASRSVPGMTKSVGDLERAAGDELGLAGSGKAASVGAAGVRSTTLEQEGIKSALGAEKLSTHGVIVGTPLHRTLASPSLDVRQIAGDLAETKLIQNKNTEGIPSLPSVEQNVRAWHGPMAEALGGVDGEFLKYRLGADAKPGVLKMMGTNIRDLGGTPDGKMKYMQFREEVAKAMRRNDEHETPEVAAAAKHVRETIIDPLKQRAIDTGLLPEDVSVDTADSYITRLYDIPQIIAKRGEFEARIEGWLSRISQNVDAKNEELSNTVKLARAAAESHEPRISPLQEQATESEGIYKKAKADIAPISKELKLRERTIKRLSGYADKARKRVQDIKPTGKLGKDDPLYEILSDIRKGPKQPESLAEFIRRKGGLQDVGDELKGMDAQKLKRGIVKKKGGLNFDDAARMATEAGYFPTDGARVGINDFIDALKSDLDGKKIYSELDYEAVQHLDHVNGFAEELDRLGIDVSKMSNEEIAAKLDQIEGGGTKYVPDTAHTRARSKEAAFHLRRLEKQVSEETARLRKAQDKWDEIKAKMDEHGPKSRGLREEAIRVQKLVERSKRQVDRVTSMIEDNQRLAGMEPGELKGVASELTDKIIGGVPGRTHYSAIPLTRGPLKERTLGIPDAEIEDFLHNDIEHIIRAYTRTMSTDVELTHKFGSADMAEQIAKINDSYAKLRDGVKGEKELKKLEKQRQSDISDIEGMRDRIRGTYAMPEDPNSLLIRAGRTVRQLNFLRLLGGMTISSVSDAGRAVMLHGMSNVMRHGIVPLVKGSKLYKVAANEAKLAGTALDMVLDSRALQMADLWDDYGRFSKGERAIQAMTDRFGVVSAMAPWNAFWKQFSGILSQTRTLQVVNSLLNGDASPAEVERLAFLGIGQEQATRIAEQFSKHGKKDSGIWWANTGAWTDPEAVNAMRHAIAKEVDITIVTPGQDRPLWMSTEMGKVVGQFRSFTMSSMAQVTQLGLQRRDAAFLQGAVLSVGLGMLSMVLRKVAADQPIPDDPRQWISEGIDRSAITSWISDANSIAEKITRNRVGLALLTGKPSSSRYSSRNAVASVLGPTFGTVSDAFEMTGSLAANDWSASDTSKLRQMIPYQNLFYLRRLFNAAEHGANDALGVPEKKH